MEEKKAKQAMPPRRDPECYELQHAILIPKGTILRQEIGYAGAFTCPAAGGRFTIERGAAQVRPADYKRVIG